MLVKDINPPIQERKILSTVNTKKSTVRTILVKPQNPKTLQRPWMKPQRKEK